MDEHCKRQTVDLLLGGLKPITQLPAVSFELLVRFLTGMRQNLGKHEGVSLLFGQSPATIN